MHCHGIKYNFPYSLHNCNMEGLALLCMYDLIMHEANQTSQGCAGFPPRQIEQHRLFQSCLVCWQARHCSAWMLRGAAGSPGFAMREEPLTGCTELPQDP